MKKIMILDNATALSLMKQDVEYFYYDIVDIKFTPGNISVFCRAPEDLLQHAFIWSTRYDEEILIDIHSDDPDLICEAISFAKKAAPATIYLSVDEGRDPSGIHALYPIELHTEKDHKHWGIYGAITDPQQIPHNPEIAVSEPTEKDVEHIASLSNKEWVFLPQRIKFMKNLLLAKRDDSLLGYLVFDRVEPGHCDIAMLYTHPDGRRMGVATALVKAFALLCEEKNERAYFVCANSEGSAELARSLHIPEMRKPNTVYKLI